jgi:hypothetical protein
MMAGSVPRNGGASRGLSLQPAASNLSHRLGQRFRSDNGWQSVLVATLVVGNEQKTAHIARKRTNDGEEVAITIAGSPDALTWRSDQGTLSSGRRASGRERELIERLVFDSPDQFVLAQLRGASYYTVARDVRPTAVGGDYSGAKWDIVRVDDSNRDPDRRPLSSWRLYYLNTETGLIDRVVSQVQGETIEAEILGWTDHDGEKLPSQITWTKQGQTIMQYHLTDFSHAQE